MTVFMRRPAFWSHSLPHAVLAAFFFLSGEAFAVNSCHWAFQHLMLPSLTEEQERELDATLLQDHDDITNIRPTSPEVSRKWDEGVQNALERLPMPIPPAGEVAGLSDREIKDLHTQMKANEAMRTSCTPPNRYDPDIHNQTGFCFGRAIGGHLLARNMKLTNDSIRKVWAVGPMAEDGITWSHHVAVAVRRHDGKWFVLDSFDDDPLPVKKWFDEYNAHTENNKLMLFATKADRFGPTSTDPLLPETAAPDSYNGFFHDVFTSARREGQSLHDQIRSLSR